MESISGSLTLNSNFGEGTEVILTFPVATQLESRVVLE